MTEEEFLEFWHNFQWPEIKSVNFRLYYNDTGEPLFYSQEDLPGKYIDVTPEQFAIKDISVKIIDEKIVRRRTAWMVKLVPSDSGTLCHAQDITLIVSNQPGQYWKKKENVVESN